MVLCVLLLDLGTNALLARALGVALPAGDTLPTPPSRQRLTDRKLLTRALLSSGSTAARWSSSLFRLPGSLRLATRDRTAVYLGTSHCYGYSLCGRGVRTSNQCSGQPRGNTTCVVPALARQTNCCARDVRKLHAPPHDTLRFTSRTHH